MQESSPDSLLAVMQLADSFFPSGMYAHSHGLEGMVNRGLVKSASDVAEFLENQFIWSVMPSEGVALLEAYRATENGCLDQVIAIDELLLAMKSPSELRNASTQYGHRVLIQTEDWVSHPIRQEFTRRVVARTAPGNGAVAMGVTGSALALGARATLSVFCHSHTVSILGRISSVGLKAGLRAGSWRSWVWAQMRDSSFASRFRMRISSSGAVTNPR